MKILSKEIQTDKQLHFIVSAYTVLWFMQFFQNAEISAVVAILIGAAKEIIHDKFMARGTPDWNDMKFNMYGIIFSYISIKVSPILQEVITWFLKLAL